MWDKMFVLFRSKSFEGHVLEETQGWEGPFWSSKISGSIVE
jgi:hypothetical protein